jgi:hypothetical protein
MMPTVQAFGLQAPANFPQAEVTRKAVAEEEPGVVSGAGIAANSYALLEMAVNSDAIQ